MKNHLYNLMIQLVTEHKSLWRIKNMYKKDAENCSQCIEFWKKTETEKERQISEFEEIIKDHYIIAKEGE